jgi:integrase
MLSPPVSPPTSSARTASVTLGERWAYYIVISILAWPSGSCTALRGTPRITRCDANVWRLSRARDKRHSFASWLKQAGTDSMVVAKLLGHASTAMVERVYGHLGADNFRRAVAALPTAGDAAGSKWVSSR